jgi:hypothetical protein
MQKQSARIMAVIGAAMGWLAVITQLYLMISNRVVSIPETILRFFSFFTIDTNILVALCFTFIFLRGNSGLSRFFTKATTITAITIYITIVGIVYNVILRSIWQPEGLQKVIDELLHSVIPALFILFWLIFVPIEQLKWKNAFPWLIYPIVYMTYAIIHGAITKFYPYPFVNVDELGYNRALLNAGGVLLIIFFLSLALIAAGKLMKKFDDGKKKVVS